MLLYFWNPAILYFQDLFVAVSCRAGTFNKSQKRQTNLVNSIDFKVKYIIYTFWTPKYILKTLISKIP